jgi:hypothetical protein
VNRRTAGFVLAGLLVALVLAFGVSRLASGEPDGLNRVAADHGLDASEEPHSLEDGPFAGYTTRGVDDDGLGTGLAGIVGVAATFVIAGGAVRAATALRRRRARPDARPAPTT